MSESLKLLLDLARQGVIDDPEMREEGERQENAIANVEGLISTVAIVAENLADYAKELCLHAHQLTDVEYNEQADKIKALHLLKYALEEAKNADVFDDIDAGPTGPFDFDGFCMAIEKFKYEAA